MRKPAFCIFSLPLYSDIIFFIDHYCAGGGGYQISIAYCFCFFHFYKKIILFCIFSTFIFA